ncbi:MAG: hypothetical protein RL701_7117, partial [Pseudomonadota bacterium]
TPVPAERAAAQRAIFGVQRELENIGDEREPIAVVLCDRGTIDGAAYWPGHDTLWQSLGVTRDSQLARYDAVIHLRTPAFSAYNQGNPLRIESASEAARIDYAIELAWAGHSQREFVPSEYDFLHKAHVALTRLRSLVPACCRPESD